MQKAQPYLNADETPQPVWNENKLRRGFVWTFVSELLLLYVFSPKRSGQLPKVLLAHSEGSLQVDGHTGYNAVCLPDGRKRVGCLAHVRRKFFTAVSTAPKEAQWMLDRITDLYLVEARARELDIVGTDDHITLRQLQSKPLVGAMALWLADQEPQHPPKSPLSAAITYAIRLIAKGRDNFLWVGHDDAGENLALLQTFVSTCQLHDVNPYLWFKDVLIRIQTHSNDRIDDLMPHRWKQLFAPPLPEAHDNALTS